MEFFEDIEIELPPDDDTADPHVRVVGIPENVTMASNLIRQTMEPHNKITMKMDVSWTHHSHIIGKAGNTIQPVVRRTGVSIHFPDGNKNNDIRKSNQVSINSRGEDLSGLEEARASIRQLTPLIFTFAIDANAKYCTIKEPNTIVQHIQGLYNVQVELSVTSGSEPLLLGSVRGSESDVARVKEATLKLLMVLCGSLAQHISVQMKIEVSVQHQSFVLGRNNENIKRIMQTTSTLVQFPDYRDQSVPPLQKTTVTISGGIENVYAARQNIIGSLPLVLMFETSREEPSLAMVEDVFKEHGLHISDRMQQPRADGRKSVVIKGAEKDAMHIYEAWKMVTGSNKLLPKVMIPPSYHIANVPLQNTASLALPQQLLPPACGGATSFSQQRFSQSRTSSASLSPLPFSTQNLPSPLTPTFAPPTSSFPTSHHLFHHTLSPHYSGTASMWSGAPASAPPMTPGSLGATSFPFPSPNHLLYDSSAHHAGARPASFSSYSTETLASLASNLNMVNRSTINLSSPTPMSSVFSPMQQYHQQQYPQYFNGQQQNQFTSNSSWQNRENKLNINEMLASLNLRSFQQQQPSFSGHNNAGIVGGHSANFNSLSSWIANDTNNNIMSLMTAGGSQEDITLQGVAGSRPYTAGLTGPYGLGLSHQYGSRNDDLNSLSVHNHHDEPEDPSRRNSSTTSTEEHQSASTNNQTRSSCSSCSAGSSASPVDTTPSSVAADTSHVESSHADTSRADSCHADSSHADTSTASVHNDSVSVTAIQSPQERNSHSLSTLQDTGAAAPNRQHHSSPLGEAARDNTNSTDLSHLPLPQPSSPSAQSVSRDLSILLAQYDRRAPGVEKEMITEVFQKLKFSDYEAKQILASKAMREPVGGTVRVPTSNWSGYGFSKSSPSYQLRLQFSDAGLLRKTVDRVGNGVQHGDRLVQENSATTDGSDERTHDVNGRIEEGPTNCTFSIGVQRPSKGLQQLMNAAVSSEATDDWPEGSVKWSASDAVARTVSDSGLAASITSSNPASLTLSDPESSDGLTHSSSACSSFSSSGSTNVPHTDQSLGRLLPRFSASNFNECVATMHHFTASLAHVSPQHLDLASVLQNIGLTQYIDLFNQQEVDLMTFLSLDDNELKELGISAFGHRKRLLVAIKNLSATLNDCKNLEVKQQQLSSASTDVPISKTVKWSF